VPFGSWGYKMRSGWASSLGTRWNASMFAPFFGHSCGELAEFAFAVVRFETSIGFGKFRL
jgi:hypothetical protein